jgi:hypothetical protein
VSTSVRVACLSSLLVLASLRPCHAALAFASPVSYAAKPYCDHVVLADVNLDGKLDAVVSTRGADSVLVFLGHGDGTFGAVRAFATGGINSSVAVGDLNGDGKPDIVSANYNINTVSVLLGAGDGTFGAHTDYAVGRVAVDVAILDLDADGKPDVVVCNNFSHTLAVLMGTGGGSLAPAQFIGTGIAPTCVAVGELSGDGRPDLVSGNNNSGTVNVYLNDATLPFAQRTDYGSGVTLGIDQVSGVILAGLEPGLPDLVTSNSGGNLVSVLRASGGGSFSARTNYRVGVSPAAVGTADLSGDLKLDVVSANTGSDSLSVLLGNGDGTLQPRVDFPAGPRPRSVAIGDLNGDTRPDIVVTNVLAGTISVLLNQSTGFASIGGGPPSASQAIQLLAPRPNPVHGSVEIRFVLPMTEGVEASIYDVEGRLVRSLVRGETLSAGSHSLQWEGRTASGSQAPSGVYLLRLDSASGSAEERIDLLR